jgi:hypothetical protein
MASEPVVSLGGHPRSPSGSPTAQIDSVKAYVAGLPEPVQQEIIVALGRRAFSEPGIANGEAGTVGIPPEQVLPVLEKAIDAIEERRWLRSWNRDIQCLPLTAGLQITLLRSPTGRTSASSNSRIPYESCSRRTHLCRQLRSRSSRRG